MVDAVKSTAKNDRISTIRINVPSIDDSQPFELINRIALIMSAVYQANESVTLGFRYTPYISPMFAVAILAMRDKLSIKGKNLYFNSVDLSSNIHLQRFFESSGIAGALSPNSSQQVTAILKHRKNKEYYSQPLYPAHRLALGQIRSQSSSSIPILLFQEAFNAANAVLPAIKDMPNPLLNLFVSKLIELYDNALSHSKSLIAYSMVTKTKTGDYMIVVYDCGIGIPEAYREYAKAHSLQDREDHDAIQWATQLGTSTKQIINSIPRGAGLSGMKEIVDSSNGQMTIASGYGYYQYDNHHEFLSKVDFPIEGTLFLLKLPAA